MDTQIVATRVASRSRHKLGLLGALLACTSWLGCMDSMSLGGSYDECLKAMTCSNVPIDLDAAENGIGARATSKLSPVWTRTVSAQKMVRATQGGVWLVSTRDSSVVLVKMSEAGEAGEETVVPGLAPLPNTTSRGRILSATFHAKGPVVTVAWDHFSPPGFNCPGTQWPQSAAGELVPGKLCHAASLQTFVFDETSLAAPVLVDPCVEGIHGDCSIETVLRSGDGQSLLVLNYELVKQLTLAGVVTAREKLPLGLWGLVGTATSADGWALLAGGPISQGSGGGTAGLVTVRRGQAPRAVRFENVDNSSLGAGVGELFTGPQAGQLIAVVESSASTAELGEPGPVVRPGDLSVLRIEGEQLQSQRVFRREDYSSLRLLAAAADEAGNAFLATSTGNREADFSKTLTPLLCRAKLNGDSACWELPGAASELQSTHENVLFARSGNSLSRFDVAP